MANEISKIDSAITKLRERRADFIKQARKKIVDEAKKIISEAGADAGYDIGLVPGDELSLDTLATVETNFNLPIAALRERKRQLENLEKKKRLDESVGIIEKMTAKVESLREKLATEETALKEYETEMRLIDNHLRYRGNESGAIVYQRAAHLVFDSRVNAPARKSHLEIILNY